MKNKANILHKINSFKNNVIEGKKETTKTKNTINNKETKISLESANDYKNIPNLCITAQRIKINKHTKITAKNKEINYKAIHSSKKRIIHKNYSNDKLSFSEKAINKSIPKNIKQRINSKKENKINISKRNKSSNNLLIRRNKSIGNLTKILVKKNNENQNNKNNKYEKKIKNINNNINHFNNQLETNQIVQNNQNHYVNKNCNLYPSISNYNKNYQNLSTNKTKTGNTFNSMTNGGFNITYNNMQNDELSNRNPRNTSVRTKTKIMNKDLYNPKIYNCNIYKDKKSSSIDKTDPRIRRFNDDLHNIIINNENIFQQKSKLTKNTKKKENEKIEFNNINSINNINNNKNNRKTEINKRKNETNALINYNKLVDNAIKKRGNILYQYILLKGNAEYLLRYCMQHRVNWIESNSPDIENTQFFNFKWKELSIGIDYFNLNKNPKMKQMVNHYEFHQAISNKAYLFINLMKYCEKNNLSVFKYVPFTIIFKIKDRRKIKNKMKQKRWMDKLEKLKNFIHRIDTKVKNFSEIGKYYNNEEYIQDKKSRDEFELMKLKKKSKNSEEKKTEDEKYMGLFEVYSDVFPRLKRGDNSLKNKEQNEIKEKEKKAPRIIGSNTLIEIPDTHFKGRNMWVLKAVNLNRGMCIKVVNSFQQMEKVINKFKSGVDYSNFTLEKIEEQENNNSNDELNIDKINEEEKNNNGKINKEKNLSDDKDEKLYNCSKILIQKYIESPLLYKGRKCDMRIWVLLTHDLKVYIFKEGHLKTCSIEYDVNSKDAFTHITNYSFQKHNSNFQKFEKGNEVPFYEFQKFIDEKYPEKNYKLKDNLMKQIKDIIKVTMLCAKNKFCKNNNRGAQFEIFGYDFMMDSDFNVFLIEINSNPGLELSSPWIQIVVPRMLDDALRLTLDKVFEPVYDFSKNYKGIYTPEQKKLLVDSEIKIDFNAVNTNNSNNANSNNKNITTNSMQTKNSSSHLTYASSLTKTSNPSNPLSNDKIFNINIELDDFDKQLLKDTIIENCNNNENKEVIIEENKNDKKEKEKEKEKQINDNKNIKTNKKKKKNYISPFPVPGYSLEENLWDYIFDLNSKDNNKNQNQNNIKNKEVKDKNSFTGIKHLLKRKKTKPLDNLEKNKDL